MKYYIPTSNINLDNILQSECILPPTHYNQRISGYNSFEQIEQLRSFISIVLFDYPVHFTINDTGRYNFPILIEIEDEYQSNDFEKLQEGVYVCNHAIQLTPSNCRVYFFSKQAYDLTLINTKSNKSIKFFSKYTILPDTSGLKTKPFPELSTPNCKPLPCEDKYIDKQKGAMYAYLLGQKLSLSADLASLLKLDQEIYNILTSLIATPSLSTTFGIKLSKLVEDYREIDSIEKYNQKVFNEELDNALGKRFKFLKGCFIGVLNKLGLWDTCFETLCKKWNCHLLPNVDTLVSSSDYTMFRNEIGKRTISNIEKHQSNIKESLQGISVNGYNIVIENMNLVNKTIEHIIEDDLTPEALSAHRMAVYMGIMQLIVPIIKISIGEEKWNASMERNYINNLHAHIEDPGVPFDINSINNEELKAIVCFILRGHSFSDLTALLKLNAIEDYRASLVLWGTLCGYYGMNRDSLQLVLSDENYEEVYKKLFGKELGKITNIQVPVESQPATEEEGFNVEDFKFLLEKFKFNKDLLDEFVDAVVNRSKTAKIGIANAINYVCGNKPYKKAKKQCELAKIAYKAYLLKDNKVKFTEYIKENLKTGKAQKETFKHFGFGEDKDKKSTKLKTRAESDLFSVTDKKDTIGDEGTVTVPTKIVRERNESISNLRKVPHKEESIIENTAWINECASMISDSRARKQFIEDMVWFVENHHETYKDKKKGTVKGYYAEHDCTNGRVIERLKVYMENKLKPRNEKMRWLAEIYAKIPTYNIIDYISKLYGI